jgi:hypothetical protein
MRDIWIMLLVTALSVGGIAAMNWMMGPPGRSLLWAPTTVADSNARHP